MIERLRTDRRAVVAAWVIGLAIAVAAAAAGERVLGGGPDQRGVCSRCSPWG